jgi:hypothetical protein
MSDDLILKKIKKMLNLAARAGTEEEGKTALLKAQEMMLKHSVDESEVNGLKENNIVQLPFDINTKRSPLYVDFIASSLSKHFPIETCKVHIPGIYSTVCIIGRKSDAEYFKIFLIATLKYFKNTKKKSFYEFLNSRIIAQRFESPKVQKANWKKCYLTGFSNGLDNAMLINEQEKGLIVITPNAVIEKIQEEIQPGEGRSVRVPVGGEGYSAGSKDGFEYAQNNKKNRLEAAT